MAMRSHALFCALATTAAFLPFFACGSPDARGVAADAQVDAGQNSAFDAPAVDSDPTPLPSTTSLLLTIDDMEVRNDRPTLPPGSAGFWWPLGEGGGLGNWFFDSAPDGGAMRAHGDAFADSIVPPRGDSMRARHLQGSGRASTDLYAQLKHPSNGLVDLSPYLGITFWARINAPNSRLIVALRDNQGGPLLAAESVDAHFAQSIAVSEQWERFTLFFDDFHQGVASGNGSNSPFTANAVSTIDFVVLGVNGGPFDLWIDDLALVCRGVCRVRSF
jgi:hypothetical protein